MTNEVVHQPEGSDEVCGHGGDRHVTVSVPGGSYPYCLECDACCGCTPSARIDASINGLPGAFGIEATTTAPNPIPDQVLTPLSADEAHEALIVLYTAITLHYDRKIPMEDVAKAVRIYRDAVAAVTRGPLEAAVVALQAIDRGFASGSAHPAAILARAALAGVPTDRQEVTPPETATCVTCHGSLEGGFVYQCAVCAALDQTREARQREMGSGHTGIIGLAGVPKEAGEAECSMCFGTGVDGDNGDANGVGGWMGTCSRCSGSGAEPRARTTDKVVKTAQEAFRICCANEGAHAGHDWDDCFREVVAAVTAVVAAPVEDAK